VETVVSDGGGDDEVERRSAKRRSGIEEHGIVSARIRPGSDASVIDVSSGGALVETLRRLMPGTNIELQLSSSDRRTAIRGRVIRCAVACLNGPGVRYRGAIAFDGYLPWFVDVDGYAVPAAGTGQPRREREDATPNV
jgi:hypothetical protein